MSIMEGRLFEKVGVNISTVMGELSPEFSKQIPGAENNPKFWASGISLVAHMWSPHIPAVHMNNNDTLQQHGHGLGGGADLLPMIINTEDKELFHTAFPGLLATNMMILTMHVLRNGAMTTFI